MKSAEQAVEYAHARFPNDEQKIYIAATSYGDAVERMQSIWKKPSERPEIGRRFIGFYENPENGYRYVQHDTYENHGELEDAKLWCYWSDFLSLLLPDWAKDKPNATDEAVKAGFDLSSVKPTSQAQMDVITGKPFQEEQK